MWTLIILFWCQSPRELARGLVEGTQSLFSNTVFAFSNAVTRISKAAHKVCTLYFVLKSIYNSNNYCCGSSDLVSWSWYALVLFLFLETLSTCMLPSFPWWGTGFPCVGATHMGCTHYSLNDCGCALHPLATTTTILFCVHSTTLGFGEWIWSQWSPLLLMQSVEWRQTIYAFYWKVVQE